VRTRICTGTLSNKYISVSKWLPVKIGKDTKNLGLKNKSIGTGWEGEGEEK
jgi:hypothetical protein